MLCDLAHSFPPWVARLLERDRSLRRNFREETITDLLMAGLVGLEPLGIRVDFPDETKTGGDMEWVFAAPLELKGGRYLRLILQAKRPQFIKLKSGGYWCYQHLDHGDPPGQQAQTLVTYAKTKPSGNAALPLYIFYHPTSALAPFSGEPAIEGVNLTFADKVAPVVWGGCGRHQKKVAYWRKHFMPLSDILCWPTVVTGPPVSPGPDVAEFVVGLAGWTTLPTTPGFHPDLVALRLRERRQIMGESATESLAPGLAVEPAFGIPEDIRRAIAGETTDEDRKELKRPRVIFSTRLRRDDPFFDQAAERVLIPTRT
jgi:Family of unknown function (DUF6615)